MKTESLPTAFLLAISGGYYDAYTYICRGGVFSNAETGNMVMLGISAAKKDFHSSIMYLLPILAFALGVFFTEMLKNHFSKQKKIISTSRIKNFFTVYRVVLLIELVILASVACIPHDLDFLANVLISFLCAMQVDAFRKWHGNAYATTMCTGNLRTASELLHSSILKKDSSTLRKSLGYFSIIMIFIVGAVVGFSLTEIIGIKAILFSMIPIFIVFMISNQSSNS